MSTRIEGIIDRLTDAEFFNDIRWILGDGVVENYVQSVIDAHIKANFEFQAKAGLPASMTRSTTTRKACKWCQAKAGKYTLDNVPADAWTRHERCNCVITYIPIDGQTIQTLKGTGKKWEIVDEQVLKERKRINLDYGKATAKILEFRKIVGMDTAETAATNATGVTAVNNTMNQPTQ